MLTEPDVRGNTTRERFRPRTLEGSSDMDLTSRQKATDSSEEAEVFIGPATSRLCEREVTPDYTADHARMVGKPMRRSSVCWYFLSKGGCQRVACPWKHVNPEVWESDTTTPLAKKTSSSPFVNGNEKGSNSSYCNEKMKELRIQNEKLTRRNQDLESENRKLKSLCKNVQFLEEDNVRLRRVLREHLWDQEGACQSYFPPQRSSAHYMPSEKYRHPTPSWQASPPSFERLVNDYSRSRFLDKSARSIRSDPEY